MFQKAIQLTNNNIEEIAEKLSDYTAADIRSECQYMLNTSITPVLVIDIHDDETVTVSHIVSLSMFYSNATAKLTSFYFQPVTQL